MLNNEQTFDMAAHLARQRKFSERTFGPGARVNGVVNHIRKELDEILAAPDDISEWIDVAILALDGAWRAGYSPDQIIAAMVAKQAKNEGRQWPDWRTAAPDAAIEHVRESEVLQAQEPKGDQIVELLAAQKPLEPEFAAVMQQCLDETLSEAPDAAPQPPVPCQCAGLEPVAWLHNERKQADVITSAVKKLLTEEKARYGFDSLMQRAKVDKSENYTIPLVRQSDAAAIIAELRAEVERLTSENDAWKNGGYTNLWKQRTQDRDETIERQRQTLLELRESLAQQAERIANLTRAIDEQMVSSHLGVFNDGDDPRVAINKLLCWSQDSGGFFAKERIAELEQHQCSPVCVFHEGDKLKEQAALIEKCEKALNGMSAEGYSELLRIEALAAIAAQKGVSLEPKASSDSSNHKTLCKQALKQVKDLEWYIKSMEVLMLPLDIDCSKIDNGDNI